MFLEFIKTFPLPPAIYKATSELSIESVQTFGGVGVISCSLTSHWQTSCVSCTSIRPYGSLLSNVFKDSLLKLPFDCELTQLLVDGHDLRFGELIHSHAGIDADLGTNLLSRFVANTKDTLGKPDAD